MAHTVQVGQALRRFAVYCGAGVYVTKALPSTVDNSGRFGIVSACVEVGPAPVAMRRWEAVRACVTARACGVGSWVVSVGGAS